jgi:uncharacterized protein YciI
MNYPVTDEDVRELAGTARPYSLAVLRWADRQQIGAGETEAAHQRRMVKLRRDGKIAILCPVASDTICGVAILAVSNEEANAIMDSDPCVQAGIMTCEVLSCQSFAGDTLP